MPSREQEVFLERAVPDTARDAYRRDAWSGLLGGAYSGAIFPFVGFIARDRLHADVYLIGLMTAAPFIGSALAILYANAMEGRKKMPYLVWPLVVARAIFFLMLFAKTPLAFALIVSAGQMIGSIIGPPYAAILKEIYPDDHRGRIMAYIRVGMAFTVFVSTLLVGRLLNFVSFQYIFPIATIFGIASTLAFGSIKTAPVLQDDEANSRVPTPRFLKDTFAIFREDKRYLWFTVSVFTFGFGNLMIAPLYPIYQVDRLNIKGTEVAMLANISTAIWMISYLYWGRYVDMRSPFRAVMINVLMSAAVPLVYFFATDVWMLIPVAVIGGITMGGVELSYFNSILCFSRPGRESQYQALHSFFLGIRGAAAPFLGAALVSSFRAQGIDVKYVFLVGMCLMLLGALFQATGCKNRYDSET